jgi:hypothetical protein
MKRTREITELIADRERRHDTFKAERRGPDLSDLDAETRLELLVGMMWDEAAETLAHVKQLRLQSNASVTTRATLESLEMYSGLILFQLFKIAEQINDWSRDRPRAKRKAKEKSDG